MRLPWEFDTYEQTIHRWHEEHPMPKVDRWFEPTADPEASSEGRQKTAELLAWERSRDEFTESLGGISAWLEVRYQRINDEYSQRVDEQKARVKKAEQEKEAAKH
jgi:hypothetical protein